MDFSHLPSAVMTNSATNALHAFSLFCYFSLALYLYLKGNVYFRSLYIVGFFFIGFVLKVLGVYAHYYQNVDQTYTWLSIGTGVVFINYCLLFGMKMPRWLQFGLMILSLIMIGRYSYILLNYGVKYGNFMYIAILMMLVYISAAIYSKGLLRLGLLLIVFSQLSWIGMREYLKQLFGSNVSIVHPQYLYDNDIYHVMLIISSFLILHAIHLGDWPYPDET